MAKLYKILTDLCDKKRITGYRMCKDLGLQPSIMTDLKMGRRSSMKIETANKIAEYFGVSIDYLLGAEQEENSLIVTKVDEGADKLRSIARMEEVDISPEEDKKIREYIDFLLQMRDRSE